MSFQRILIALDEGPLAAHAAEIGFGLARSLAAEVALVHVVEEILAFAPETGIPGSELLERAEQQGSKLLAKVSQQAKLAREPLHFVAVGRPAADIVKTAREWKADVIVMGSHGRTGLKRVLMGSVAEEVMRHAPCPILVIRAKE